MATKTKIIQRPDLSDVIKAKTEAEAEAFVSRLTEAIVSEDERAAEELAAATGTTAKRQLGDDEAEEAARSMICYHVAIYHHADLARIEKLIGHKHAVYQAAKEEVRAQESGVRNQPETPAAATTTETQETH